MSLIVGIDLGTTNSLIGAMDAGFPVLIAGADGSRLTPSAVHFPVTGKPLVGAPARRMAVIQPERTVLSVKRFMGRRFGDLTAHEHESPCRLGPAANGDIELAFADGGGNTSTVSPELVSAHILGKLKADAERSLGQPVTRAVITVPAYFNDAQRTATKRAGELAGLTVERIVSEPTAAALAYGLDKLGDRSRVAVFDLGGGTFDLSILELDRGVFQVIATHGDTRLGGDDIDRALTAFLIARLEIDQADPHILARITEAAIAAKHALSDADETRIDLPFLTGPLTHSLTLRRSELEHIATPIIDRTRAHCLQALHDAKVEAASLNAIILVGGSTRMPLVRRRVAEWFGREPDLTQHPDEAVALGATLQAGVLSGVVRNVTLLDVTPLSLGIETFGGLMNVIIPRNTTIPCKAGEMFTNAVTGQTAMRITALQGEREMARDNWKLGEFALGFEAAPKGQARVGVQFAIDADGILSVLARETMTGTERVLTLKSAIDVADEAVERMIAESVEHAFEDMSERVLTEARLKGGEMLPAVRTALNRIGADLDPAERAQIGELARNLEALLDSGSAQQLKRAIQALDDATQNLAARLVDMAMEEALRRKGVL